MEDPSSSLIQYCKNGSTDHSRLCVVDLHLFLCHFLSFSLNSSTIIIKKIASDDRTLLYIIWFSTHPICMHFSLALDPYISS